METSTSRTVRKIIQQPRWTQEEAKVVLEAATRSGLPLRGFAAEHEISQWRVYRWKQRLRKETVIGEPVRFEEVTVSGCGQSEGAEDDRIEVVLRSGHRIRVGAGFDETALRRVMTILDDEGTRC